MKVRLRDNGGYLTLKKLNFPIVVEAILYGDQYYVTSSDLHDVDQSFDSEPEIEYVFGPAEATELPEDSVDTDSQVFRTYEGWINKGRCVLKGEKASGHVAGKAIFGKHQTSKVTANRGNIYEHGSEYGSDSYYGADYYGGNCVDNDGYY